MGAIIATSMSVAGIDLPKWMLKPWANISIEPGPQVGRDLVAVDAGLDVVGDEHHDDVAPGRSPRPPSPPAGRRRDAADQARESGRAPTTTGVAGVVVVQRVGVALAAVADDRDRLARQRGGIAVGLVVDRRRLMPPPSFVCVYPAHRRGRARSGRCGRAPGCRTARAAPPAPAAGPGWATQENVIAAGPTSTTLASNTSASEMISGRRAGSLITLIIISSSSTAVGPSSCTLSTSTSL